MVRVAGPQLLGACFSQAGAVKLIVFGRGVGDGVAVGVGPGEGVVVGRGIGVSVGRLVTITRGCGRDVGNSSTGLITPRKYDSASSTRQDKR